MNIISSGNYEKVMNQVVIPWIDEHKKTGTFACKKDQPIYYEHYTAENPKGTVVMVHGFTEGIGKHRESIYYFLQEGFHVFILQQREHGKSWRSTEVPYLVNIEDYNDLISDLHYFVHEIVKKDPETSRYPLYLYAHSMGGGVSACYLERYPEDFSKAVLSSPMLEMKAGSMPVWAAAALARILLLLKKGRSYLPGGGLFTGRDDFENSCTTCRERYLFWLKEQRKNVENQTCAASVASAYQFLKLTKEAAAAENCTRIKAKVLLLQAGKDTMVGAGGQETFIRQIGSRGRLVRFDEARHEIYAERDEILTRYWDEIFKFLR